MMVSEKTEITQDTFLVGIGASPGIAIGETFMLNRARIAAVERHIAPEEVPAEIDAFMTAVRLSKKQLEEVKQGVTDRHLAEHLYIIDTHLLILEDQLLIDDTTALVKKELLNAEGALKRTLSRFREVFDAIEDEFLRERRSDMFCLG